MTTTPVTSRPNARKLVDMVAQAIFITELWSDKESSASPGDTNRTATNWTAIAIAEARQEPGNANLSDEELAAWLLAKIDSRVKEQARERALANT